MAKTKVAENSITLEKFKKIFNEYKKAKEKIEKDFKLDLNNNFNFFEAISDTYKKENLHSDLMKQILDPTTKEIGNISYLKSFLKIIGVNDFGDLRNVKVERECNRIDILISNNKNAIIIENKINNAPDQDKQLERYYNIVSQDKKTVIKIVYITLSSEDNCEPSNLKGYGDSETIEKLLIHLPAVSKDTKKKSLINWLDECIKKTPENNIGKIFLEQYKQLLAYLGGNVLMLENKENCIKKIFNNKGNLEIAKDLVDIWKNKAEHLCSAIAKDLVIKGYENFSGYTEEGSYRIYAQEFNKFVNKYFCSSNGKIEIGFYIPTTIDCNFTAADLGIIGDNYKIKEYVWEFTDKWIFVLIDIDEELYKNIYDIIKDFFDNNTKQRTIPVYPNT